MNWEECLKLNVIEKRTKDEELAKSLLKIAVERFNFFSTKNISLFTLEGIYGIMPCRFSSGRIQNYFT
jgi:hypothetical protein